MSVVQRIDGTIVEHAEITDVQRVGDEGAKRGLAHIEGMPYPVVVYKTIVDGFDPVWYEQKGDYRDYETNPWSLTNRNGYWHD